MFRFLFYLTGLISLTSCYGITDFQKSINDAKLCGATTGLESKIYLNGIYVSEDSTDSNNPEWKSSLIFYPDGSFIVIDVNMGRGKDFLENLNKAIKKAGYNKRKARWNWEFGTYAIHSDTITAYHYYPNKFTFLPYSTRLYWMLDRYQFIITGKNRVQALSKHFDLSDEEDYHRIMNDTIMAKTNSYIFVPLDNLPSSDFRYKKKKWIWKDEDCWKKFKNNKQ